MNILTSYSEEVCDRIIEAELHDDLLKTLSWDPLSAEKLNDRQSKAKRELVEHIVDILYNVVRKSESARDAFRRCHAVDVLDKLRDVTESQVRLRVYFIRFHYQDIINEMLVTLLCVVLGPLGKCL